MKYAAVEALEDLWKLDEHLRGIHQQEARDAWTRIHNFLIEFTPEAKEELEDAFWERLGRNG